MNVTFTSHLKEITGAYDKAERAALEAIGSAAENHAKNDCPVKTGTLKRSLTHKVQSEESAVYIGTNIWYAIYVEFGENKKHAVGKAHFLRGAATEHDTEYKTLAKHIFENA